MVIFFWSGISVTPQFRKMYLKIQFLDRFSFKSCRFSLVILLKNLHNNDVRGWIWLFWRHRFSVYLKITKISLKNAHFSVFGPISVGFSPISVVFFFKIIIWTISDIMVTFFFPSGNPVIPQFRKMYPKISFLTFSVKKLPISFVLLI